MSENHPGYNMQSRGYKTKGNSYKDRYITHKMCPECGRKSIYENVLNTIINYKCLRRSCKYEWSESKFGPAKKLNNRISKYEQVKIDEKMKEEQEHKEFVNDYLMNADITNIDRVDTTKYTLVGYAEDDSTEILGEHLTFDKITLLIQDYNDSYTNFQVFEEKIIGMVPSDLYIVANTEGFIEEVKELFYRPITLNETFILLGNFIGKINFLNYMQYLLEFKNKRPCIFIKGINEHNLLEYIHETYNYLGTHTNSIELIDAIERDVQFDLKELPERYPTIYRLLKETKDYFENDTHIIVSGGVDLSIPFWKQSDKEHLYLTSKKFLDNKNYTGKTIIFGDRDINTLSGENNYGIWHNNKNNKIGINGNVASGNKLIGLSILDNETNFLSVKNKQAKEKRLKEKYNGLDLDNLF